MSATEPATEQAVLAGGGGWFTRLLMRNTPLPALLHSLMPEFSGREHGRLQFIEDAYLPSGFQQALPEALGKSAQAQPTGFSSSNFFLHDRQPLRGGVILQRLPGGRARNSGQAEQPQSGDALRAALRKVLRAAGRAAALVLEPAEFPALHESPGPAGTRTAAIVIWPAEQPALERWFGGRVADAPARWVAPAIYADADRLAVADPAESLPESSEQSLAPATHAVAAGPVATLADATQAVPVRRSPIAAVSPDPEPPPADPTGVVHTANRFAYRVVGHTRGPVAGGRRYHIRRSGSALRVALLADERRRLPAEDALDFFKRLDFGGDLIESHRLLLRGEPIGAGDCRFSLSLEVDCDSGQFRCVSSGIVPLFFRQQGGRLYALPHAPSEGQSEAQLRASANERPGLKTVAGRFRPGDAILIVPGGYTGSELRDLAGRHREILAAQLLTPDAQTPLAVSDATAETISGAAPTPPPEESEPLPSALAAWLDARLRGRGLFLQMSAK